MEVISGVEILIKVEVIYDLTSYKFLYEQYSFRGYDSEGTEMSIAHA
jgi:hypothetical protein